MDVSTGRMKATMGTGAGGKAGSDDGHSGRIGALYLVLLIDLVLNNVFEPPPPNLTSVLVLFILQLACLCGDCVVVYILFTRTHYFQVGLFGPLFRSFRAFFIVTPLTLGLFLAARIARLAAYIGNNPPLLLWESRGYYPLYICNRLVYLVFYVVVIATARELANPKYYQLSREDIRRALK